jgi:hypothetical protein
MKKLISILLLVAFSANILFAQRPRPGVPAVYKPTVEKLEISDAANDFGEKGLPEPEIIGSNLSAKLAVSLAQEISKYDENSLPLLMAALQKAGFYIIDENQKILYKPSYGKGMGLAFYDFEVAGMLKLSRRGIVTTVEKFGGLIQKDIKEMPKNKIAELMLQDLKTALTSKNSEVKFWAKLIIELGKTFPQPIDLLTATPENAQINIIQASLWERRIVGDLISTASKQSGETSFENRQNTANLFRPKSNKVSFLNASFYNPNLVEGCDYANLETTGIDVTSMGLTTAHGKMLEFILEGIGKSKDTIAKVGNGLGIANLVLSWAKLIAAVSQIKGELKVEEPLPLIRTKSSRASEEGEKRLITGKFEIKMNKAREVNCYRLILNSTTGLDFNMPGSGALAEKPVSWELGGDVSFKGQNSSETGVFDAIVHLIGTSPSRDFTRQETDGNGESKIYIEGGKQKQDLTNQKLVPLPRKAKVRADIALKNMKDSKQEMADVGGVAFGIMMGGISPVGILSTIPEIGNRMEIPVSSITVPIRDWQPCTEDWGGIISVKREFQQTVVVKASRKSNGNSSGEGVRTILQTDEADITLNPRTAEEILKKVDKKPADIVGKGIHSNIFRGLRDREPCCGKDEGSWTTQFQEGTIEKYSGYVKERFNVSFSSSERDYSLSLGGNNLSFPGSKRAFMEVDSNCKLDRDEAYDTTEEATINFSPSLPDGRYGNRFINSEGELLAGEKEITDQSGAKLKWKWALARCSK